METPELEKQGHFLEKKLPLWVTIVLFLGVVIVFIGLIFYFKTTIYNYTINIPKNDDTLTSLRYGPTQELANSDYFSKVKGSFIESRANFIEADLSSMSLRVYKEGAVIKEVPILTKGKEGSWWETPAGLYKIELKETNHFSSIGKVYQPWSMIFQGNFFIHGWPYYPNGTEVSSTYSGGCIRLSTADAKMVYDLAVKGMPILVHEKDFTPDDFQYSKQLPALSAQHYLIADLMNDEVLLGKDLTTKASVASITKLITGLVTAEYINLDNEITISSAALASTSRPRLQAGEQVSVYNLMFPLLMESSNEAAESIARNLGRSRFIGLMNSKAQAVGMNSSIFTDPAGSDAGNISTPEDLFALAKYLYNNRSFLLKITAGKITTSAYGTPLYSDLKNFNIIPGAYDPFVGGKIGKTTAAQETYIGVFDITVGGKKRPIVFVALGSKDVYTDIAAMLNYVHREYQ
ncbi:MAG: L,D-transpeptidase family protein [bacterium]|nr:L,D-transpeptidase family protein [bacterium]